MVAWEGQPGKGLHVPKGEGNGEKGGVEKHITKETNN